MQTTGGGGAVETQRNDRSDDNEDVEGLDHAKGSLSDYHSDELLIRQENRTIHDVIRRIDKGTYVMDPEFQREFIWPKDKQSKLIESVIMRIPLPVFYMAENDAGRMVVVDGLQRLSTFVSFAKNKLRLNLPDRVKPDRGELHKKRFSNLNPKLQNRFEDCNLIFYTLDSKVPEQARLDIFERVNAGVPLSRQQMRNCLFMGPATKFLKQEAQTGIFQDATGNSLNTKTMRDREFVNRFCAFQILDLDKYNGNMDEFLAECLRHMNKMSDADLAELSNQFRRSLANNFALFERHAFRKHAPGQDDRAPLNASLWDVMSTGLSRYARDHVTAHSRAFRSAVYKLFADTEFVEAITYGPNDARKVRDKFSRARIKFREIPGAHTA